MKPENGRNRQQPEYLNEKDAAEDRQGINPGNEDQAETAEADNENEQERKTDIGVRNAFRH